MLRLFIHVKFFGKRFVDQPLQLSAPHNHPSGNPSPSQEDIQVTKRLCEAGKLVGIEILDHLVIGDRKYVSLKEKGYV